MPALLALVEQLTNALEHRIRLRDRERELERLPAQVVVPLRFGVGVEPADERVVRPAVDGPEERGDVAVLVVEVGRVPDAEEEGFGAEVDERAVGAVLEECFGGVALERADGEGALEALAGGVVGDDFVGALRLNMSSFPVLSIRART